MTACYLRDLHIGSMMLRIVLAMFIGGFMGFEREKKRRAAGFRTYMLVALGASLTVILSQYLTVMLNGAWADVAKDVGIKTDVSRFGAQVINGIGFLGAGTIIVTGRQEVQGLKTAAGLWASGCMGLAIGAGFYEGALTGFVLMVVCVKVVPFFEEQIMLRSSHMNIYVEMESIENLSAIVSDVKSQNIRVYDIDFAKEKHEGRNIVNALVNLGLPERRYHSVIIARLAKIDGILSIEEV